MKPHEELEALWQQKKEERARQMAEDGASIASSDASEFWNLYDSAYARGEEEGWTALEDIEVDEPRVTPQKDLA